MTRRARRTRYASQAKSQEWLDGVNEERRGLTVRHLLRSGTGKRLATAAAALIVTLALVFAFVATRAAPKASADAITGCRGNVLATATSSGSGYTLTVSVVAQFGIGGDFGKGYCGSMKTSATMTVPAAGVGGGLTVTLAGSDGTSLSNSFTFPNNTSASFSYTFTEYSPSGGPKCASGTATFAVTSGQTFTATTKSVCPH